MRPAPKALILSLALARLAGGEALAGGASPQSSASDKDAKGDAAKPAFTNPNPRKVRAAIAKDVKGGRPALAMSKPPIPISRERKAKALLPFMSSTKTETAKVHPEAVLDVSAIEDDPVRALRLPPFQSVADGFTTWAFTKAKGEISYGALLQLHKRLENHRELETAFLPATRRIMAASDTFAASQFAVVLKGAARSDLNAFPDHLDAYLDHGARISTSDWKTGQQILAYALLAAFPRTGQDPMAGLANLATAGFLELDGKLHLRSDLTEAEKGLFALGLLVQTWRVQEAQADPASLIQELQKYFPDLKVDPGLTATCRQLLEELNQLKAHVEAASGSLTPRAAEAINGDLKRIFDTLPELARGVGIKVQDATFESIRTLLASAVSAYADILQKDYATLVVDLRSLAMEANTLGGWDEEQVIFSFAKWTGFLAAVAAADSQEKMNAAMDSISDSVSSYRATRYTQIGYQSVKTYLGWSGGREILRTSAGQRQNEGFTAAFAPVGFEWGRALDEGSRWKPANAALFFAPIDLGAFSATRFNSKVSDNGITFKDVFTPTAALTFGLSKNFPFTLGVGVQYAPYKRRDAQSGDTLPATRILAFLAIEVPIFTRLDKAK